MLDAPQTSGAKASIDDLTVAMQRIIDQAMDLVPSPGALTGQDEAALARLAGFTSTVAGAMWHHTTLPQLIPDAYAHVAVRPAMSSF